MPRLGDALKKAVQVSPDDEGDSGRSRPSSALMNPNRRRIFQYLCRHPCSGAKEMSSVLKLSRSTVKWHIDTLVKSDYIDYLRHGRRTIYCPTGLLSRKAMGVFTVLSNPVNRGLYRSIVEDPGQDRSSLSAGTSASPGRVSKLLEAMQGADLINTVRDGKHVRYYPTEEHIGIIDREIASQKQFVKRLIKKMKSEHLKPQVSELKGGNATIEVRVPGQTATIVIPNHPFENLFKDD